MAIYVFVSDTDQNANQALNSGRWAFPQNKRPAKNSKMGAGDLFIIYSAQSKKIFGAGMINSSPQFGKTVSNSIWNGTWYDPVNLGIVKHNLNGIDGKQYFSSVPSPNKNNKGWNERAVLNNNLSQSDFNEQDFKFIVQNL